MMRWQWWDLAAMVAAILFTATVIAYTATKPERTAPAVLAPALFSPE